MFNAKLTLAWLLAACIRAIKTVAQTALGMFTVGASIGTVDWKLMFSVAIVAGTFSLLTSMAGLPETTNDDGSRK